MSDFKKIFFGRKFSRERLDGWNLEDFEKLSKVDQDWLLQFASEYSGQSSQKDRKILPKEELSKIYAQKQKNQRSDKIEAEFKKGERLSSKKNKSEKNILKNNDDEKT